MPVIIGHTNSPPGSWTHTFGGTFVIPKPSIHSTTNFNSTPFFNPSRKYFMFTLLATEVITSVLIPVTSFSSMGSSNGPLCLHNSEVKLWFFGCQLTVSALSCDSSVTKFAKNENLLSHPKSQYNTSLHSTPPHTVHKTAAMIRTIYHSAKLLNYIVHSLTAVGKNLSPYSFGGSLR